MEGLTGTEDLVPLGRGRCLAPSRFAYGANPNEQGARESWIACDAMCNCRTGTRPQSNDARKRVFTDGGPFWLPICKQCDCWAVKTVDNFIQQDDAISVFHRAADEC